MKIIYYYHIPKCGGTTISNELKRLAKSLRGEYHNFNTPMRNFGLRRKVANKRRPKRNASRDPEKLRIISS